MARCACMHVHAGLNLLCENNANNISFVLLCHCKVMTIGVNKYFVAQMTSLAVRYDVIYQLLSIFKDEGG